MKIEPAALEMENVAFAIAGKTIISGISLDVSAGEMLGVLGPNGAGKSTLLRTIYRVNRPSVGVVRLDGADVWRKPVSWVARNVGAVLQDLPADFPLTVRDIIAMGRSAHKKLLQPDNAHDHALIDAAVDVLELADLQHRAFRTLSGGERQRALLARALVQQPRLMVLDEPTNHLDIHHQLHLLRFVRRLNVTIVAALHDLNLAAMFCDRMCLMNEGRVVALGPPEEVLQADLLSEVYRIDAAIERHPKTGTPWVMAS